MIDLIHLISKKVGMQVSVVTNIIELLDQGNTVPFIARYRKEMTQGATDEQLEIFMKCIRIPKILKLES
jgi:protein Tex